MTWVEVRNAAGYVVASWMAQDVNEYVVTQTSHQAPVEFWGERPRDLEEKA